MRVRVRSSITFDVTVYHDKSLRRNGVTVVVGGVGRGGGGDKGAVVVHLDTQIAFTAYNDDVHRPDCLRLSSWS